MASVSAMVEDEGGSVLGVEHSLQGQRWLNRATASHIAAAIAQRYGLPEAVARVLSARGVGIDDVEPFLEPSLRNSLPDPSVFKDMDKAAQRLAQAIIGREKIVIFGDYDVDGATSSAVLIRFIRALGGGVGSYIPDRLTEGYGPNAPALQKLAKNGARLVITVDCGIQAYDALAAGAEAGLDILVVDHHKAEPELPTACALVNPNRLDDESNQGHLAAVGVAFLLAIATNRVLRGQGYYAKGQAEPDLLSLLDVVALGTVCDVVPLTGLNRSFVRQGLKVMATRRNIGLTALMDVAGLDERPDAYHLGFVLGPRINAGGRVGEAHLGTRLLTTGDMSEAKHIALHLNELNKERQAIENAVQDAALMQIGDPGDAPLVFAYGNGWHAGVVGIVASRLKERFKRPAIVIGVENAVGKGSGRSIAGVDLGAAIIAARQEGLLVNGGGHAMAAGLTVEAGREEALREFLISWLLEAVVAAKADAGLRLDGVLSLRGATPELISALEQAGPYGVGNPTPRFAIGECTIVSADVVGRDHVRLILAQNDGARIKAMAFRQGETQFGQTLLTSLGRKIHVAGKLKRDDWGRSPRAEIHLDDAALVK